MEIVCITDVDDVVQNYHNLFYHRKVMEEVKQATNRMVNPVKLFTFSVIYFSVAFSFI